MSKWHISVNDIELLEKELSSCKQNFFMGLYVAIAGVLLFISNAYFSTEIPKLFVSGVIGGAIVFCCFFYDKKEKIEKNLDRICYLRYDKPYKKSSSDIFSDRYHKEK